MKTVLGIALGLAAAIAAWAGVARTVPFLAAYFDPFLVLVLYHTLRRRASGRATSPLSAALVGSAAGLGHDVLTGGILGLYGFADTVTAWAVSKLQQRMDLQRTLQVALAGLLASAFQLAVVALLRFFMTATSETPSLADMALRVVSTGALLASARLAGERFTNSADAWRERRRKRLRFDV